MSTADPRPRPWDDRFVTLDGMRGLAALAVALFHYNISQAPHGYVAVDFFFALSGFVLARAYFARWQAGMATLAFMKQRAIRLYPLFLVGLVVTTLSALANPYTGKGAVFAPETFIGSLPFNTLMLPSPFTRTLFPMNVPAWSLFFELVANWLLVVLLFRLPRLGLLLVTLAAACWFAPVVLANEGGNLGAVWDQVGTSMVRTVMSFTAGVLIARLPQPSVRPAGWIGLACLLVIGALLLASPPVPEAWYDLAFSMIASPLLVWLGARYEPPRAVAPVAWFLGEVSYGLYAVHWALMEPLRYFKDDLGWDPVLMGVLYLSCCVGLAWLAVRYVDRPMRRWFLARGRRARASAVPAARAAAIAN